MADPHSEYHRGEMDIHAQQAAFSGFVKLTKWGSLAIAAGLIALVLWFCTNGGFLPGAIAFFVVLFVGIAVLREKGGGH